MKPPSDAISLGGSMFLKRDINGNELAALHPNLHFILGLIHQFYSALDVPMVLTSLIRHDGIHGTGRAADVRTAGLTRDEIEFLTHKLNIMFPYGTGQDGVRHDTVVRHRLARCAGGGHTFDIDFYREIVKGLKCPICRDEHLVDCGPHLHVQVNLKPAWGLWDALNQFVALRMDSRKVHA